MTNPTLHVGVTAGGNFHLGQTISSQRSPLLAAAAGLIITVSVVRYPEAAFSASLDGLRLWFDVVLPALLPFFAMADILMGLGVIHAVGVLLEPLMRPVFRIPGVGGFAVAMGLASGYPLGAKISGQLRRDGLCTREEGERLISFANTADPLFMVGAVAIGMFGLPQIGLAIVVAHYAAAILVGFAMRFHAGGVMSPEPKRYTDSLLRRAYRAMLDARANDNRPIGTIFGDAVRGSINSMLFVGGCIMMFSVFLRILTVTGVTEWIALPIGLALSWTTIDPEVVSALIKGLVEITIGSQAAAVANSDMVHKVVAASAIVAWSGFSVHAQVAAMVHNTDIRIAPYLIARGMHALFAAIFTYVLFEPLGGAAATMAGFVTAAAGGANVPMLLVYWGGMGVGAVLILAALLLGAWILYALSKIHIVFFRVKG